MTFVLKIIISERGRGVKYREYAGQVKGLHNHDSKVHAWKKRADDTQNTGQSAPDGLTGTAVITVILEILLF